MLTQKKKPFKYYAIRIANMIVFRRTVKKLTRVKSVLYRPRTDFRLEQVTYTGGTVVGCMSYYDWTMHGGNALQPGNWIQLPKERFRALGPYMNIN